MIFIYKKATPLLLLLFALTQIGFAQTPVSGRVIDTNKEPVYGANVVVKGTTNGAATNENGEFTLSVGNVPPFTLQVSFTGYLTAEAEVNTKTEGIQIILEEDNRTLDEVVVTGPTYGPTSLGSAPVTVEVFGKVQLRQNSAEDAYGVLSQGKGIQYMQGSLNFPQINTRGFATIANVRFVQLVDWMDVSAPLLNFPTGNIVGLNDLDLQTMELVPGASSALYGPNAFNGILLMNSKNPFKYQGLSAQVKLGVTTSDAQENKVFPMSTFTVRYAKAFKNKFAFKVNFSYMKATDWYGNDYTTDRNHSDSKVDLSKRADFDGINLYGDEIEIPTGVPSIGTIHRTGFREEDVLDNRNAKTMKGDVSLHYKITNSIEASYTFRYGGGSSVYQGSQKYALRNFTQNFNKLEVRGENFFVRGYVSATDAGKSFNLGAMGAIANEAYNPTQRTNGTGWAQDYVLAMQGYIPGTTAGDRDAARAYADRDRPPLGTPEFNNLMQSVRTNYFQKDPAGAKFTDNSKLYHGEFQYRFTQIKFIDLMAGANVRQYNLFSNGTIFNEDPDGDNNFDRVKINEFGGYLQASKTFMKGDVEAFTLTGSLRFDKNENFDGRVTPRISAVYSPTKDHHIRVSYQTGFRNPDTQAQFIFFNLGTNILLGSTEANAARYGVHNGGAWTDESYKTFKVTGDSSKLVTANIPYVKPEQLQSFEIGYKFTGEKFFVDLNYYYSAYTDFIGSLYIASKEATTHRGENLKAGTIFTPSVNSPAKVKSQGVGIGLTYNLPVDGFQATANYNYAQFSEDTGQDPGFRSFFNTPTNKYNVGLNYFKRETPVSFNVNYRYQDEFLWESDFGTGMVGAYGVVDAQVSYKLMSMKSVVKLGANNLFGGDYRTNFGGPFVGQMYYLSLTFDPKQF